MRTEVRNKLLEHFAALATDADAARSLKVFLPLPRHLLALRVETAIILGARGAGKTAMFHLVRELGPKLPDFYDARNVPVATWLDAFSEERTQPAAPVLDDLSAQFSSDGALRAFWMAHLLGRLVDEYVVRSVPLPPDFARLRTGKETEPSAWVGWAEKNPGAIMAALDAIERSLGERQETLFATYDALDRIGLLDRRHRQRLIRTLLALWLTLSNRYRNLRAKIFLRHDLFEEAERGFSDASKLRQRSATLDWDVESLFRLVVRHLANTGPHLKVARDWLLRVEGLVLEDRRDFGFAPGNMPKDVRKSFASAIAGEVMGSGVKKGYTHRWIPDRLQDADGRIVPRSILRLFANAARHAQLDPLQRGDPLMLPIDLSAALIDTSRQRASELEEEYEVVKRLENLRRTTMLMEKEEVVALLDRKRADKLDLGGDDIFEELRRIGVLEQRSDGRIDVPDIYRYGYGIKRKGGVRRPR